MYCIDNILKEDFWVTLSVIIKIKMCNKRRIDFLSNHLLMCVFTYKNKHPINTNKNLGHHDFLVEPI